MSNQTILSSIFILSWLSLLFMKKEDIKRFFPVGLFATVTSAMISKQVSRLAGGYIQ
ncbi:hypothetical protein [Sporomusa rhizae]|uniref:hypothetical protein n=1 Tax=Sporomusa rhizae TaxID=357999 RepID=UPI00352A010F